MRMGVVGLGTLTVMELGTPSRTKTSAKDPFDQLTIDVSVSPDTLETADRLEMHHLQHEAPLQPVSPVESPPDLVPRNSSAVELGANNKKDAHLARPRKQTASKDEIRPPRPDERGAIDQPRDTLCVAIATIALTAAIALAVILGSYLSRSPPSDRATIEAIDVKALVERIIKVESSGIPNAKNKLSSASGAGQFLDDTWLEAVRNHRRHLIKGRSDKELLELRQDAELTKEIITLLVGQYARTLRKRGLPLTSGSLYLAYFAGPAGAVALLSGAEYADAASVMAAADTTGRTTRQKLVRANPFLELLTVGDLRKWADDKMRGL